MARGKRKATPQRSSLTAHNFLPTLTKPMAVLGKNVLVQGRDWGSCPAADKDKWFQCTVRKFEAVVTALT